MEKKLIYPTRGVCSQAIEISMEDDVVKSVQFYRSVEELEGVTL